MPEEKTENDSVNNEQNGNREKPEEEKASTEPDREPEREEDKDQHNCKLRRVGKFCFQLWKTWIGLDWLTKGKKGNWETGKLGN